MNDTVAKNVAGYIWEIANCVGIFDETHIHIVPGNHDLDRKAGIREDLVRGIYPDYQDKLSNGNVDEATLSSSRIKHLVTAFSFFHSLLYSLYSENRAKKIWDSMQNEIHYYTESNSQFNILCMNTAIMSVEESENERGKLVVSY